MANKRWECEGESRRGCGRGAKVVRDDVDELPEKELAKTSRKVDRLAKAVGVESPAPKKAAASKRNAQQLVEAELRRLENPKLKIVRVPEVVRALDGRLPVADVHRVLFELTDSGAIELHPDAGSEFLPLADARLCPPGPRNTVFSYARILSSSGGKQAKEKAAASKAASKTTLAERIRVAYLRVSGGKLNEFVRLAPLRAELRDESPNEVDAELRAMQKRGEAVLYPIDDPQRIRKEDNEAALQVSGERRDLFCILPADRRFGASGSAGAKEPDDLKAFAARVLAAARRTPKKGWFGSDKVFIHRVFETLKPPMDLDEFKNRLIEAHRAGFLNLNRADLVEAMDADDVEASNTYYLGGKVVWNFVRVDR